MSCKFGTLVNPKPGFLEPVGWKIRHLGASHQIEASNGHIIVVLWSVIAKVRCFKE